MLEVEVVEVVIVIKTSNVPPLEVQVAHAFDLT